MSNRVKAACVGAMLTVSGVAWGGVSIISLPSLGGEGSLAADINDNGWVVGQATVSGNAEAHAVVWVDGVPTDLGAIAGNSYANAINNANEIVGWSDTSTLRTAMRWSGGVTTNLGADMNAVGDSVAWDINDNGVITGQASINPGFAKGFVWSGPGTGQVAGSLPGYMGGANYGINNNGVVVGSSFFFGDPDDAHLGTPDGAGGYTSEQISPSGFVFAQAKAINNDGVVVGHTNAGSSSGWQACIYNLDRDRTITTLGSLPGYETSEANDINDLGVIVGSTLDDDFLLDSHAWVYMNHQMIDLNDLLPSGQTQWQVLLSAEAINNSNDVVGYGILANGELAGFVMSNVPGPGAAGPLMLMGLALVRRRR